MNLYENNSQSKALQKLIHDTNSALQTLRFNFDTFEKWWKEYVRQQREKDPEFKYHSPPTSEPYIHIEYMRSKQKAIEKAIDAYYSAFKNDFHDVDKDSIKQ